MRTTRPLILGCSVASRKTALVVESPLPFQSKPAEAKAVPALERHYSPCELADIWRLSAETIRSIFEKESGVLIVANQSSQAKKRRYRTFRIPEHVAIRVWTRLSSAA
jgi:hypothetical protein